MVWRSYLAKTYLHSDHSAFHRMDLRLNRLLGPWLPHHHQTTYRTYYFQPSTLTLYRRQSTHYFRYSPTHTTRRYIQYSHSSYTSFLPTATYPIDPIVASLDSIKVDRSDVYWTRTPATNSDPQSFPDYVATLDRWERTFLSQVKSHTSSLSEIVSLTNQPFIIATDGSIDHNKGSFGWVLAKIDGTLFVQGAGTAYGATMSSFWSESYGILSVL